MRNMSFMLTTQQVEKRTKNTTRRWGWYNAKAGDRYRAVRKAMGLKKGEKIEPLATIEILTAKPEPLEWLTGAYGAQEMRNEGFPDMEPADFIKMLNEHKPRKCQQPHPMRITFRYID